MALKTWMPVWETQHPRMLDYVFYMVLGHWGLSIGFSLVII